MEVNLNSSRAFVYDKKLTAISHYYKFCYVKEIVDKKAEIAKLLSTFFEEKVKALVSAPNYVIDFVVIDDKTAMVVEINPFV